MKHWVGLVAIGAISVLTGCSAPEQAAAPVTVTATETFNETVVMTTIRPSTTRIYASYTEEIEVTVTESVIQTVATTEMVTVSEVAPPVEEAGSASFGNGSHLIGSEIPPGSYRCTDVGDIVIWEVSDSTGGFIDGGVEALAFVPESAFSVTFTNCNGEWAAVG